VATPDEVCLIDSGKNKNPIIFGKKKYFFL